MEMWWWDGYDINGRAKILGRGGRAGGGQWLIDESNCRRFGLTKD